MPGAKLILPFLFFLTDTSGTLPAIKNWHLKKSPHFEIYHQANWAPGSVALELEKIYGRMRFSMAMFAPWMVREKTNIYIYKNRNAYLNGEFKPPHWSKGLGFFQTKTVVVFDTGDAGLLRATLAHELSHIYLESYFSEKLKYPPQWINEGLAVMQEDEIADTPQWSQALGYAPGDKLLPLNQFFDTEIKQLNSKEQISYWYLQAFGVVSYLFRPVSRIQFKNLCAGLRAGEPLSANLWKSYRFANIAAMEQPWREWLRSSQTEKKQSNGFSFKPFKTTP